MKSKMRNKPQFIPGKKIYTNRAVDKTKVRQRFLIVCEGEKTEPEYFRQFRVPNVVIDVEGNGFNTLSLVDQAMVLRKEDDYDQVWCVFDKDDFPIDHFDNAIQKAKSNDIHIAYSNQAFELWYVLHFEYLHTAISRKAYMKKLDKHLKFKYKKKDPQVYQCLKCKINIAIQNAERLMQEYQPSRPGRDDPVTTVHELVKALLEQAKPLSG